MINKYIQIYFNNIWYLAYISLNYNNKPYIWFTNKIIIDNDYNFNKILINNINYYFKIFIGHLYFINLISSNKLLYYLPIEIRKIIWKYINLNTL
jgi:hypothetical protein